MILMFKLKSLGLLCLSALLFFWPALGLAETGSASDPPVEEAAFEPSVHLYGFLTQAYAKSDGNQVLGIPEEGTTDYRNLALQVRWEISRKDAAVVQINHEAVGESPDSEFRDDLELDWAFYRRNLTDYTQLKVGRVPIPLGQYNEVRDTGTVLPFYRAPSTIYGSAGQSAFTVETVDGALLSHVFAPTSDWAVETSAYYGGFDLILDGAGGPSQERAENTLGLAAWLNTPVPNLRFGAGGAQFELDDEDIDFVWASLESSFGPVDARAEWFSVDATLPLFGDLDYEAYWFQLGYTYSRFQIWAQAQFAEVDIAVSPFFQIQRDDFSEIYSVSLSYFFTPRLVLRGEWHDNEGLTTQSPPADLLGPPLQTKYYLLSLAASFGGSTR